MMKIFSLGFVLAIFLCFPEDSQAQDNALEFDILHRLISTTEDTKDFESLYKRIYNEEDLSDSSKMVFVTIGAKRTKGLGLDYHYAQFIFYQSILLTKQGDFAGAITLANESLEIFLDLKDYREVSECYNTVGGMMAQNGDNEKGISYLLKAIMYNNRDKYDSMFDVQQSNNLIVYGNILLSENRLDSALSCIQNALTISQAKNLLRQEVFSLVNIGKILKLKEQYLKSKHYFLQSLKVTAPTHLQLEKAIICKHISDIYAKLNKQDSAIYYLNYGLDICEKHASFLPIHLSLLDRKTALLASEKKMGAAYELLQQHRVLRDSFLSMEKEREIKLVLGKFDLKHKERDIELLSQQASIQTLEIKQKNQQIVIGLIVFLFVLVVLFFFYKHRSIRKKQIQTELEQRFLRSQLNPHFISNALVSVQTFMLKHDSESAVLYLTKFSKLMREILENSRKEFITVEDEVSMLTNYLDLHQQRLKNSFSYEINIDDQISAEEDTIPPMFVQPFVENAIEHGIVNSIGDGKIIIGLKKEGEYIAIEIRDNGGGLAKTASDANHKSLSSNIIKERMDLFNRSLKNKIKLVLEDVINDKGEVGGTKVDLKVPFSYV